MKRIIEYRVTGPDKNGVSPSMRQWGGMQYEDKATEIIFNIGELHSEDIQGIVWRIDFDSSSAGYSIGENLEVREGMVSRLLEYDMTRFGGEIQVTLIGTKLNEDYEEESIAYFIPVKVYLTEVEQHGEALEQVAPRISGAEASALEAAERAKESEEVAREAADMAVEAKEKTQQAKFALEKDAVFVFLGGDAESSANIEIVVDDVLSETSENPVQNKAVMASLIALKDETKRNQQTTEGIAQNIKIMNDAIARNANDIENMYIAIATAALNAHPVGSLYWTSEPNNPENILGGTWEMVDKEFAPVELYNTGLTINTDVVSSGSVEARLAGHTVEITVAMANTIEIGDTNNINWGTLTPSSFGCSEFSQSVNLLSQ